MDETIWTIGGKTKKFKRALITGASKGLGKEVATQLLLHCENLVLLGRDEPALINLKKDLKKNYAGEIDIFVVDLMNNEDLEQLKRFSKRVDLLINNAGLGFVNEFTRMSEENLKSMLLVNNYALTILTHHFANTMLQKVEVKSSISLQLRHSCRFRTSASTPQRSPMSCR